MKRCPECMTVIEGLAVCPNCGNSDFKQTQQIADALPTQTTVNNRYVVGMALGISRQSICYLAYDEKAETVVLLVEFFPRAVAARNGERIAPVKEKNNYSTAVELFCQEKDEGSARLLNAFAANGTAFRVYELADKEGDPQIAAEQVLDSPVLFRKNGQPIMSINCLPIPAIPRARRVRSGGAKGGGKKHGVALLCTLAGALVLCAAVIVIPLLVRQGNTPEEPVIAQIEPTPVPAEMVLEGAEYYYCGEVRTVRVAWADADTEETPSLVLYEMVEGSRKMRNSLAPEEVTDGEMIYRLLLPGTPGEYLLTLELEGQACAAEKELTVAKYVVTPAPTAEPTDAPTDTPTPTAEPTDAPTDTPTPTAEPTDAPTAKPTDAPTAKPTDAPTAKPTDAPTAKPTEKPTDTRNNIPKDTVPIGIMFTSKTGEEDAGSPNAEDVKEEHYFSKNNEDEIVFSIQNETDGKNQKWKIRYAERGEDFSEIPSTRISTQIGGNWEQNEDGSFTVQQRVSTNIIDYGEWDAYAVDDKGNSVGGPWPLTVMDVFVQTDEGQAWSSPKGRLYGKGEKQFSITVQPQELEDMVSAVVLVPRAGNEGQEITLERNAEGKYTFSSDYAGEWDLAVRNEAGEDLPLSPAAVGFAAYDVPEITTYPEQAVYQEGETLEIHVKVPGLEEEDKAGMTGQYTESLGAPQQNVNIREKAGAADGEAVYTLMEALKAGVYRFGYSVKDADGQEIVNIQKVINVEPAPTPAPTDPVVEGTTPQGENEGQTGESTPAPTDPVVEGTTPQDGDEDQSAEGTTPQVGDEGQTVEGTTPQEGNEGQTAEETPAQEGNGGQTVEETPAQEGNGGQTAEETPAQEGNGGQTAEETPAQEGNGGQTAEETPAQKGNGGQTVEETTPQEGNGDQIEGMLTTSRQGNTGLMNADPNLPEEDKAQTAQGENDVSMAQGASAGVTAPGTMDQSDAVTVCENDRFSIGVISWDGEKLELRVIWKSEEDAEKAKESAEFYQYPGNAVIEIKNNGSLLRGKKTMIDAVTYECTLKLGEGYTKLVYWLNDTERSDVIDLTQLNKMIRPAGPVLQ